MNISSVIIHVNQFDQVLEGLGGIKGCEVGLSDRDKHIIIAVIEADDVNAEMEILGKISALDGVVEANMHYSYAQEELEKARENISEEISHILSDDVSLDEVRYSGSVYNQIHRD